MAQSCEAAEEHGALLYEPGPVQRQRGRRRQWLMAVPLAALGALLMLITLVGVVLVLAAVFSPSAGAAGGCGGG